MKTSLQTSTSQSQEGSVSIPSETASLEATAKPALYRQIKLALDVHAADLMDVRRVDGAKPQPPQKMTPPRFLEWVVQQRVHAREVVFCHEAGSTGFWLHR